jgi:hypothetical protein
MIEKEEPMPRASDEIKHVFTHHPPKDEAQKRSYEVLRQKGYELATLIHEHCPHGDDTDAAIAAVRSAIMWANAAVANEGR